MTSCSQLSLLFMFVTTLLGDYTLRALVLKLNAGLESLIDNMSIEIFFTFLHQETFEVKVLTFKTWNGFNAPPWQLVAVSELKTFG